SILVKPLVAVKRLCSDERDVEMTEMTMGEISTFLPRILLAYSAFLVAIASPGPNILVVIGTAMGVGRPSRIALAFGGATGSFTWAVLTVLGLSALVTAYASALVVIKICGGLYLLWLAYKSFRSAISRHDIEVRELAGGRRTPGGYFSRGYVIQMTNPKVSGPHEVVQLRC
ncbi:MAG: LysE family translocator, partial [Litorimonas sp.]